MTATPKSRTRGRPAGMPRRIRRGAATATAALVLGACAGSPEAGEPAQQSPNVVSMHVVDTGPSVLALVPVTISGEGPFYFAVDTGTSVSVVDADIADRLALPETGQRRPVIGVLGDREASLVRVGRWAAGRVQLREADIARIDLPPVEAGLGRQGVLGSDVLRDYGRVMLDYEHQQLRLGPS